MSSLSTMTVAQLAELSNAPVVHPTGERKSKLTAIVRMASMLALKEALAGRGLKKRQNASLKTRLQLRILGQELHARTLLSGVLSRTQ